MFICTCCTPPKQYSQKKSVYRHERKTNPDRPDPRITEAEKRRTAYAINPRLCGCCSRPLTYEQISADNNRKYCSRTCAATINNRKSSKTSEDERIPKPPRIRKPCEVCGEPTKWRWENRFCSTACHRDYKYETYIKDWKAGLIEGGTEKSGISVTVRRYIFEKFENKCCLCGWKEVNPCSGKIPLQVDHLNGDPTDHSEKNLRLICPNCHSLTPTFGALNKGNGRAFRRQRYAEGKSV